MPANDHDATVRRLNDQALRDQAAMAQEEQELERLCP